MTDLRQAAQQALEALCSAVEPKKGKVYARGFEPIDCYAMHEQAITALREALEQPEQRKPLTDEEIRRIKPVSPDFVDFRSGVRCAEAAHGIKEQS